MQETNREMQNGKSATTNKNTEARNLKHETGNLTRGTSTLEASNQTPKTWQRISP